MIESGSRKANRISCIDCNYLMFTVTSLQLAAHLSQPILKTVVIIRTKYKIIVVSSIWLLRKKGDNEQEKIPPLFRYFCYSNLFVWPTLRRGKKKREKKSLKREKKNVLQFLDILKNAL